MITQISDHLISEFTQNNSIPLTYNLVDNSTIEIQKEINSNFNSNTFQKYCQTAILKQNNYYGNTDFWLYQAIDKYSIKDKDVCIFGSANPWYEAICLVNGAKSITVVEYSDRISFNEKIKYIKPQENFCEKFDILLSISSFEHDGLGRYGDPINPNGDLEAMTKAKNNLKEDGFMFLSVPIGKDHIYFNVHRVYGEKRFFKLINDWKLVETFGFFEKCFENNINQATSTNYQPIVVLTK